jgi:hypothetical protein
MAVKNCKGEQQAMFSFFLCPSGTSFQNLMLYLKLTFHLAPTKIICCQQLRLISGKGIVGHPA